jgi:hypothetical protein
MNGTTEPIIANEFIMTCLWYLAITTKDIVVNNPSDLKKGLHKIIQRFNKYLHYNPIYQSDMTQFKPKFCIYGPGKKCPNLYLEYDVKNHIYGLYPLPVSISNNEQRITQNDLADYLDKQYNINQKMIRFYESKAMFEKYTAYVNHYVEKRKTSELTTEQQTKYNNFVERADKVGEKTDILYKSIVIPLEKQIDTDPVINKVKPFIILDENTPKKFKIKVTQEQRVIISNTRVRCTADDCFNLKTTNNVNDVVSAISESDKNALHIVTFFACRSGLAIKDERENQICIDNDQGLDSIVDDLVQLLTKQGGGKKTKAPRKNKKILQ